MFLEYRYSIKKEYKTGVGKWVHSYRHQPLAQPAFYFALDYMKPGTMEHVSEMSGKEKIPPR